MQALLDKVTLCIQHILAHDPNVISKISILSGKTIEIRLLPLKQSLFLQFEPENLKLTLTAVSVDLLLEAYPDGFIRLMMYSSSDQRALFGKAVHIEGDITVAQALQDVLSTLDIDWLALIGQYFGDIPAYYTGKIIAFGKSRLSWLHSTMSNNITAYLQDEIRVTPVHDEIMYFRQQVSRLQLDVERFEVSLKQVLPCSPSRD